MGAQLPAGGGQAVGCTVGPSRPQRAMAAEWQKVVKDRANRRRSRKIETLIGEKCISCRPPVEPKGAPQTTADSHFNRISGENDTVLPLE